MTTVRRRSAGLTAPRAGGALAMLAAILAIWGLASSPVFGVDSVTVEGAGLTSEATIREALDLAPGTNLVTLDTTALARRLEAMPTVRRADVVAGLPGSLRVVVDERRPILAWTVGRRRLLVDVEGRVIAEQAFGAPLPRVDRDGRVLTGSEAERGERLPVLFDRRPASKLLAIGATMDPVELDAARRLGSLVPSDLGSDAAGLRIQVTDPDGFVLRPAKGTWSAVFGFFTPTIRSPEMVPGQVRLLRSLLATGEAEVGRVILASPTDGTYVPRPSPSPEPSPSATP
jgi:hypothetical protein